MTNTTQLQTRQAPANAVAMGTTRQQAYASAAQGIGDPFTAIIAQMLAQVQQGEQNAEDSEPGGLAADTPQSELEKCKQLLAQGASGILQMPQLQSSDLLGEVQNQNTEALRSLAAASSSTDTAQELSQLVMQMGQNALSGMQNISEVSQDTLAALLQMNAGTQQQSTAQSTAPIQSEPDGMALGAVPVEIAVQPTREDAAQSEGNMAFSQEMPENTGAAQGVQAADGTQRKAKADETFPQQLAASTTQEASHPTALSETQTAKAEQMSREPELLQQLEKSINQTLSSGNQELTMKLKPEALGEITVRLVEREGKMTLDITAASAQTAKLINGDLTALREAVRPMNVEVHEAVQQSGNAAQGTAQYNLFGQQFSSQQQFANQQAWQQAAARTVRHSESFDDTVQQVTGEQAVSAASLSALDTYV